MKCNYCNVIVDVNTTECPLCKHKLDGEVTGKQVKFPSIKKVSKAKKLVSRIIIALLLSSIFISGIVNYATFKYTNSYWSMIVIGASISLLLIYYFAARRWYVFSKSIFWSSMLISFLLVLIDSFSKEGVVTPTWSLDYTMPLIYAGSLIICFVFLFINRVYFSQFSFYTFLLVIINMLMLFRINKTEIVWPIIVCSGCAILVLILTALVLQDELKDEFKRRFHA